jgi:putative PIN family toxin of toxin-antitoxin system
VKVFLDTNVLISAFATRGMCADLVRVILAEHELLTGEVNLLELRRVLRDRFKAAPAQIAQVETLLRDQTGVPKPEMVLSLKVRDADDAWVLASAVAGSADMLVTGDQDLLVIASAAPLPILTPRAAWERLREDGAA